MFDGFWDLFKSEIFMIIDFLLVTMLGIIEPIIMGFASLIPKDWQLYMDQFVAWLNLIESWVPISFACKVFIAYYAIKFSLIVLKWILKAIPGVG